MEKFITNIIKNHPKFVDSVFKSLKFIPNKKYVSFMYKKALHKKMNWDNPKTFTQKLHWLKEYYRDPILTILVDKYKVRDFVKGRGLEEILIPMYDVFSSVDEINFEKLPNEFVLKGNHGSGYNLICPDKSKLDIKKYRKLIKAWLNTNHYYRMREWAYLDVEPKMVAEKLLKDPSGTLPDYKFFTFNGEVKFIGVTNNENDTRNCYDTNFNPINITIGYPNDPSIKNEKPKNFERMLEIAKILAEGFPFIRVDLYNVEGKIYFGEMTLYPDAGLDTHMSPANLDLKLGKWLSLPEKTN